MKKLTKQIFWATLSLLLAMMLLSPVSAQAQPVQAKLKSDKKTYAAGESIVIQVDVLNDTGASVITRENFQNQDFHLKITFTGPDGEAIRSRFDEGVDEPGPPYSYSGRDAAIVEILPPDWDRTTVMDDTGAFYDLSKPGLYQAQVLFSMETFSYYLTDPITLANIAFLDDPGRQHFDPVASAEISFEILPAETLGISSIQVEVAKMMVGGGVTPETKKSVAGNVQVHLMKSSEIPADCQPVNFKSYPTIWPMDCFCSTVTDSNGVAKFENVPQDNYEVIAYYPKARRMYIGGTIRANDADWFTTQPIDVRLRFVEKADGTKVPGKTTKLKGSELLITEPEYVEWDSTEELYPFVFESVGDWGVTTSVAPPEGFVADHESLGAEVTNETEAVQFTVTDVGSKWEETEVTYNVTHKGKKKKIKKKIGVKLSEKLAKQKGVGVWGHTPSPGPFKGGKKLGHLKDE